MRQRSDVIMNEDEEAVDLNDTINSTRSSIHSVSVLIPFGLITILLGLYGLVYTIDSILPKPLKLSDEKNHPNAFITERARNNLKLLTGLGPRVVGGHANEILAVDFLKREIDSIIKGAHKKQRIELDIQVVTGSYYGLDFIKAYSNLQNIVVKLHADSNASDSLLVNSHFDSVPSSPGASDDGINVVTMLEILRILSKEPRRPLNNLIFLFNGAEEPGVIASHGFVTKHKWAKECKVVVNLEANGHGGKIILFQTGPNAPWLLKYYCKVQHPYGQVWAEEIFQLGLIPSGTDFVVFVEFGGLVGVDMAFFKNGYRYHTRYDALFELPEGSFQHVGDNTLTLVRSLSNAPEVANPKENPGKVVYFDFIGLFMVSYSNTVGSIINSLVAILSLGISVLTIHRLKLGKARQTAKYLALTFGAIFGGWILAGIFVVLAVLVIDTFGRPMSWYANPWLIFGLYVGPTMGVSSVLLLLVRHQNLSYGVQAQIQAHAVNIIWTVILLLGTIVQIRSMYIFMFPVLFTTLAFMCIYFLKLQHTVRKWQVVYVVSLIIPTVFVMYMSLTTLSLFVPVTGILGSGLNADLIIGFLSLIITIVVTSHFVALSTLIRDVKTIFIFLGAVFVLTFYITFTPLGFPYTGNPKSAAPQRYPIEHIRRVFHNEQGVETSRHAGFLIQFTDRNSPSILKNTVKEFFKARSIETDCEKYLGCGGAVGDKTSSCWIPTGQPILPEPTKLDVLSKVKIAPNVLRYNLSVTGPSRLHVYISPKLGVKLRDISLVEKLPSLLTRNNRDVLIIVHIYGKNPGSLLFTFDVQVPKNISDTTTEIAIFGSFQHDEKNKKMPHFVEFLDQFPDWAHVTASLGNYESWWI